MYPPITQEITAAGYVAVRLPAGHGCSVHSLWTEDGSAYYYSSMAAGTDGILVTKDGTDCIPMAIDQVVGKTADGAIIGYFKGTATTNLVGRILKK